MHAITRHVTTRLAPTACVTILWTAVASLALLAAPVAPTAAEHEAPEDAPAGSEPALISADRMFHDQDLGIVTARGNVEISRGGRTVLADTVTYNTRSRIVTAAGNVSLLEPNGDIVFVEYAELTDDLKEGFIRDVRVLLQDNSRIAAVNGLRSANNRTSFNRATFSPCAVCREHPDRAPLWQIRAQRVVHDQDEQVLRYSNAWMEFFGVPVLYTPYFEHPDPTVDRQSGFLAPTIGASQTLGSVVKIPYYWVIGPTADATFEPIITTKQSVVLAGEVRHLLPFGWQEVNASGTIADRERNSGSVAEDELRGHIDAKGRYDIDENWRAGFDVERTTDDTYLRLYNFSNASRLTSSVFAEGFFGRSYASGNSLLYQGLREDDDDGEQPIVAPLFDVNYLSGPLALDSTVSIDANLAMLTRTDGRDTRRLSLKNEWTVPFGDAIGGLYRVSAGVQADGYWIEEWDPDSPAVNPDGPTDTEYAGRAFPQLTIGWRYPWVSYQGGFDQVIEPLAQIVVGTDVGDQDDIPNEDSLDFEFDDTNLFSANRFAGLDRVDSGQRIDYGLRWSGLASYGGEASVFAGQSYRLTEEDELFAPESGVQEELSDVVGRVDLRPYDNIDLLYRFRLDKNNLAGRRHEVDFRLGPKALKLDLSYLFIDGESGTLDAGDREEIELRLDSQLTKNWSGFASTRYDLEQDDTLEAAVGITYQDECFLIELVGERNYFDDREIEKEDSIFLRIVFKHVGDFGVGGSTTE